MQINDPVIVLIGPGDDPMGPDVEVDMTDKCSSCTFNPNRPVVDGQNTFGVKGQRREVKGLWDGSLALTFHHEFEDDGITQQLWKWLAGDEPVAFQLRAKDAPISADNPEWRGEVAITELPIIDGGPEDLAAASVTWDMNGVPTMVTEDES